MGHCWPPTNTLHTTFAVTPNLVPLDQTVWRRSGPKKFWGCRPVHHWDGIDWPLETCYSPPVIMLNLIILVKSYKRHYGHLPEKFDPLSHVFHSHSSHRNHHGSITYLWLPTGDHGPTSYCFWDKWRFWTKITFPHLVYFKYPAEEFL